MNETDIRKAVRTFIEDEFEEATTTGGVAASFGTPNFGEEEDDDDEKEEQFREVVRKMIRTELDEATTTANVPGYDTPFAFSPEDDEKREDDIIDFLDSHGWELAEIIQDVLSEELTPAEMDRVKDYFSSVQGLRSKDVDQFRKKSNYYPHNLEENFTEKQLRHWAKNGAPEDADAVVKTPDGKEISAEDYLRQAVRKQVKEILQ